MSTTKTVDQRAHELVFRYADQNESNALTVNEDDLSNSPALRSLDDNDDGLVTFKEFKKAAFKVSNARVVDEFATIDGYEKGRLKEPIKYTVSEFAWVAPTIGLTMLTGLLLTLSILSLGAGLGLLIGLLASSALAAGTFGTIFGVARHIAVNDEKATCDKQRHALAKSIIQQMEVPSQTTSALAAPTAKGVSTRNI